MRARTTTNVRQDRTHGTTEHRHRHLPRGEGRTHAGRDPEPPRGEERLQPADAGRACTARGACSTATTSCAAPCSPARGDTFCAGMDLKAGPAGGEERRRDPGADEGRAEPALAGAAARQPPVQADRAGGRRLRARRRHRDPAGHRHPRRRRGRGVRRDRGRARAVPHGGLHDPPAPPDPVLPGRRDPADRAPRDGAGSAGTGA